MNLLSVIQTAIKNTMDSAQLTDMAIGTVESASPLEIRMDIHQAPLKGDVIILTDAVKEKSITIGGTAYIVQQGLTEGDKVLMLAVQHGQRFIVLSRV